MGQQVEVLEEGLQLGAGGFGYGDHGQAEGFRAAAEEGEDGLDRGGAGLDEVGLHEGEVAAVEVAGGGPVVWSAAASIWDMGPGMALEATETRPVPPRAITGSARASSPARTEKVAGAWVSSSVIWPMTPLDSLMATMLGSSARRRTVSGSRLVAVRPGML